MANEVMNANALPVNPYQSPGKWLKTWTYGSLSWCGLNLTLYNFVYVHFGHRVWIDAVPAFLMALFAATNCYASNTQHGPETDQKELRDNIKRAKVIAILQLVLGIIGLVYFQRTRELTVDGIYWLNIASAVYWLGIAVLWLQLARNWRWVAAPQFIR